MDTRYLAYFIVGELFLGAIFFNVSWKYILAWLSNVMALVLLLVKPLSTIGLFSLCVYLFLFSFYSTSRLCRILGIPIPSSDLAHLPDLSPLIYVKVLLNSCVYSCIHSRFLSLARLLLIKLSSPTFLAQFINTIGF